jgi:predicted alpha-1,6-mannanase (GH76 family)
MKIETPLTLYFIFSLLSCISCLEPEKDEVVPGTGTTPYKFEWTAIADSSVTSLNHNFWNGAMYYNNSTADVNFNYWPQAHALDVMIDAYLRTSDNRYVTYMNDWYQGVKVKNGNTFLNHYYDDMEWNALAMNRAYRATKDSKWMTSTVEVWNDIKNGWNETMGGGIAWNKTKVGYKNTPANAPACILAARLYQDTKDAVYLDWAKKIYSWQKATLVNAQSGLVYDGINSNDDGQLQTDPGWSFAYNQGTYIGAALELYNITKDRLYLDDAVKTANNFIVDNIMSPAGIMRPGDNGDGGLFNGIGVRYLALLIQHPDLSSSSRENYVAYLKKNAETLWLNGTERPKVIFNSNWNTLPGSTGYLTPQLSGCILMEAMAVLKNKNLVK